MLAGEHRGAGASRRRMFRGLRPLLVTWLLGVTLAAAPWTAQSHPGLPEPPPPGGIPPSDLPRYKSQVKAIVPPLPGLEARILGNQEELVVHWRGKEPILVEGYFGEPMLRFSGPAVEGNDNSLSLWMSSQREGRVAVPAGVSPGAKPRWRLLTHAYGFGWYDHRARWLTRTRPRAVGDGASPVKIRDWKIPTKVGDRAAEIRGTLSWVPHPNAYREKRSQVSSPALSALILAVAMAVGALVGVLLRRRAAAGDGGGVAPSR
jgi:hypothetical protein